MRLSSFTRQSEMADIVPLLENYVGSRKTQNLMQDAADEINLLRDEVERLYASMRDRDEMIRDLERRVSNV